MYLKVQNRNTHSDLADNLPDLRFESHVQHTVSFIEYKISAPFQIRLSHVEDIQKTARRGDDDLTSILQSSDLRPL